MKFYQTINKSILEAESGHIIHGCNAKGKMNSGVAKAIRETYPEVFNIYENKFETIGLTIGSPIPVFVKKDLVVWNLITQPTYGYDKTKQYVSYEALETSLVVMNKIIDRYKGIFYRVPNVIHFPKIGAGLGGGDWNVIETIIKKQTENFGEKILWEI